MKRKLQKKHGLGDQKPGLGTLCCCGYLEKLLSLGFLDMERTIERESKHFVLSALLCFKENMLDDSRTAYKNGRVNYPCLDYNPSCRGLERCLSGQGHLLLLQRSQAGFQNPNRCS